MILSQRRLETDMIGALVTFLGRKIAYMKYSFNLAEKGKTDNLWKLTFNKFILNIF